MAASEQVLRDRDLFLLVAMQCVHPSQLATLSALCREFEDLVLTQRQLWRHQLSLLWPLRQASAVRDPRSLCRKLLESNRPTPELKSLNSVVMLVSFRKFGTEHSFEFNLGALPIRQESIFGGEPETVAWLPMPSLTPTDTAGTADLVAAYDLRNGWFRAEEEHARFPWMADAGTVNVVLFRTDVLKVSRGSELSTAGGSELWLDGVLRVPALVNQVELVFDTTFTSTDEWRLGNYVPRRDIRLNRRLDFHAFDGGWLMRLREEIESKRGAADWEDDLLEEEHSDQSLPLQGFLLAALNSTSFRWI